MGLFNIWKRENNYKPNDAVMHKVNVYSCSTANGPAHSNASEPGSENDTIWTKQKVKLTWSGGPNLSFVMDNETAE